MNNKIRILYLSQYFPPEMGAPSARVYELSRRWAEQDTEVTVLTGFPNHPTGTIPEEYRGHRLLKEEKDGINIVRTYIYAAPNKGFFKRICSYLSFMFSSIIQGTYQTGKQDIIIATSPQFFVGIAGYVISRLKGIPFVFEIRDLWPESIVQLGQLKNKLIIRFFEWVEMFLYRKSIHLVGVAESTVDILTERGVPEEKISVIKNGVDLKLFINKNIQKEYKQKLKLNGKFIVSYIGTHGLSHALDKVIETAYLMRENEKVVFLLVGEGAEKERLKKQADQLNLQNVIFSDQIDKRQLPEYYELSDIVLVTLRGLPLFKHVIPSKIFEIMAMKKPMIISVDGEARKLVEDANAGIFSEPENPSVLKEKIEYLMLNPKLRDQLGQNGRDYVSTYFSRESLADDYLSLIRDVLEKSGDNS